MSVVTSVEPKNSGTETAFFVPELRFCWRTGTKTGIFVPDSFWPGGFFTLRSEKK